MAELNILFVGVQAYVPHDGDRLEVYLPNATKMGNSPQHSLPMHMPSLWQVDSASGALTDVSKLRHFPWSGVSFSFDGNPSALDLTALQQAGGTAADRMVVSAGRLADPRYLGGQVTLRNGTVTVQELGDPACQVQGWCDVAANDQCVTSSSSPPNYPLTSVVNRVHARIENVTQATIAFTSLLNPAGGTPDPVQLTGSDFDHTLVIGNPCADSVMGWAKNDVLNFPDEDFWWLYQLVDPAPPGRPHPLIDQRRTLISAGYSPQQVLQNIEFGGGGGIGCECMGCICEEGP